VIFRDPFTLIVVMVMLLLGFGYFVQEVQCDPFVQSCLGQEKK
jgi:hypothetical protein